MTHYYKQLTWLRGIAAFFVICSHTLRTINVSYSENDTVQSPLLLEIFSLGTFGVLLFFVLSGCTLYLSYHSRINNSNDIVKFYIKRFFRIWPAFIVSLFIYFLFRFIYQYYYPQPMGFWVEHQFLGDIPWSNLLTYPTLTFNFLGNSGLFNTAYWSLPVEFQYYLLFPVILISIRYLSVLGPITIGLLLYLIPKFIIFPNIIDIKFFTLAYSFCGGMLIGYIFEKTKNKISLQNTFVSIIFFIIITLVSFVTNSWYILPDIIFISNKWNFYALSAVILTSILLYAKITLPVKFDSVLSFMGKTSYSTYLYHNLLIGIAILLVIQLNIFQLKSIIVFLFASLLTYILSYYSYTHIEKPGIKVGKMFSENYNLLKNKHA